MVTLTPTSRSERIILELGSLNVRQREIRDQLYRIAGGQAQADREHALTTVQKQIDRLYFELAAMASE